MPRVLRTLLRSPGYTAIVVLTLAVAIGFSAAIFSVVEGVVLRPLPYAQPSRLYVLFKSVPARGIDWDWTSGPTVRDWRERSHSFSRMAVVLRPEASVLTWWTPSGPERVQGARVGDGFFESLGVAPLVGRTLAGADLAVISHAFWQQRLGGASDAIGRKLRLDEQIVTIAGVMPAGFQFPDASVEVWLSLSDDPRWALWQQERFRMADAFCVIGRLKDGVSLTSARAEFANLSERLSQEHSATDAGLGVRIMPLLDRVVDSRVTRTLWLLAGAVICVLLVACTNVAGLLFARQQSRARELAIRSALGASPARLFGHVAGENLLLFAVGGIAGVAASAWITRFLLALAPADLPRANGVGMNGTVLFYALVIWGIVATAFGMLPAWRRLRASRNSLVVAQFALAVVLVAGAGLLLRSLWLLGSVNRGFDPEHLITLRLQVPGGESRIRSLSVRALERVRELPGVVNAAVGSATVGEFVGNAPNERIEVADRPAAPDYGRHSRDIVSDSYFTTMGIPLLKGRSFSDEDISEGPRVAVINAAMARRYWPGEEALGRRFREVLQGSDSPWMTVAGIVGDASLNRDGTVEPVFYVSQRQWALSTVELVVRTSGDPVAVKDAIRSVDRTLPHFEAVPVEQTIRALDRPRRFQAGMTGIFAMLALFLSGLGLYGLMSYTVERRRREIGIRMAVGADSSMIRRMVVIEGLRLAIIGSVIGIGAGLALARAISSFLFQIGPRDPIVFAGAALTLLLVALLAVWVPARRASKVDPAKVLAAY